MLKYKLTVISKLYWKFKERPKLFFRRLDEARNYHRGLDKDFQFSDIWIAAFYMQRCGLSKYEKEKIWERVNYVYDPDKIREAILFLYEKAHETDCTRIEGSHAVKSGNTNLVHFVAHNPDGGVSGTDLRLEYVEEQITDEMVDLSAGVYDPRNPIYLATAQKSTNIQIQTGKQDNGDQYGEEYEEEHDIRDVLWVNPLDPRVIYEDEPSSFQSEYDEDEEEAWEGDPEYEEYEYDEYEDYDEEEYPYDVNYVGEPDIEEVARDEFKNTF